MSLRRLGQQFPAEHVSAMSVLTAERYSVTRSGYLGARKQQRKSYATGPLSHCLEA